MSIHSPIVGFKREHIFTEKIKKTFQNGQCFEFDNSNILISHELCTVSNFMINLFYLHQFHCPVSISMQAVLRKITYWRTAISISWRIPRYNCKLRLV